MVKPGYKQTEIGVIPQTWNIITFSKCFKILSNNTFSRAELNENSGTVKNIHYGDILVKYNSILNCSKESIPYISNLRKKATYMYLLNGDLIIADTAEDETVGKAVEISNIGNQKIVSGLHTIPCRSLSDDLFANGWLGHYINHSTYHNQLLPFITGTKVSAISKSSIAETLILVPPIPEQERIAEALSDVDDLIFSLEKLIEKYKSIKVTCLQQMFPQKGETTPKMRLPGFTGAWEQRKLGDLGSLKNGMNFSKDAMGHGYAFVNLQNIFGNNVVDATNLGLAEASEKQLTEYSLQKGDVLFVRSSVKLEGVGEAAVVAENLENTTYSGFIIRFRDEYGLNDDFKKYVFTTSKVREQIISQATNSANKNISQSVLENLSFEIPSEDEQQQIGAYFKNLDHLITLHQRKLNKTKKIKQGMMQQLLTGKIRLL